MHGSAPHRAALSRESSEQRWPLKLQPQLRCASAIHSHTKVSEPSSLLSMGAWRSVSGSSTTADTITTSDYTTLLRWATISCIPHGVDNSSIRMVKGWLTTDCCWLRAAWSRPLFIYLFNINSSKSGRSHSAQRQQQHLGHWGISNVRAE